MRNGAVREPTLVDSTAPWTRRFWRRLRFRMASASPHAAAKEKKKREKAKKKRTKTKEKARRDAGAEPRPALRIPPPDWDEWRKDGRNPVLWSTFLQTLSVQIITRKETAIFFSWNAVTADEEEIFTRNLVRNWNWVENDIRSGWWSNWIFLYEVMKISGKTRRQSGANGFVFSQAIASGSSNYQKEKKNKNKNKNKKKKKWREMTSFLSISEALGAATSIRLRAVCPVGPHRIVIFLEKNKKQTKNKCQGKAGGDRRSFFFSSFRWMSFFFCHFSFFQNCFSQFCKTKEDRSVISVNVYFLKNCRNRK